MRVEAHRRIGAPIEAVWAVLAAPTRALSYMSGVTRWERDEASPHELGARYRMLLRVGSAQVGGLIEMVEWDPPRELSWTSVTGIDQRGRWRLRPVSGAATRVELRLAYGVAGAGPAGWLAERIAAGAVRDHLRRTLAQLEQVVEYDRKRERTNARRPVTTA